MGSVLVTVTIPDGFYTISDLNNLLSKSLFSSNFYFYNSSNGVSDPSQIIYPIQFATNAANYTNSIIFQYIPTSSGNVVTQFGTNWLYANPNIFPVHASLPTITIPHVLGRNITSSTYGLGNILGFTNGTYPASYTLYYNLATTNTTDSPTISNSSPVVINGNTLKSYTYNGLNSLTIAAANPAFSPIGSYVNGIVVRCNLVDNNVCATSDILDSFAITSSFGSNINYIAHIEKVCKIRPGKYRDLTITFNDQNLNTLYMQDPNILINLLIKFPLV